MAFSQDFRQAALRLILDEKKSRKEVSALMQVNEKTLTRWKQRAAEDRLATEYPSQRGGYKIDENILRERVKIQPDAFLHEHGKALNVSAYGVGSALKRLGISRKKFTPCYKERCKKNGKNLRILSKTF